MRILFLQKRPLFPADCGGKIRTLNVLRHLAHWHKVTYLCNVQAGEEPYLDQMRALGMRVEGVPWRETPRGGYRFYGQLAGNLFSRFPFNVNKDFDPRLRSRASGLLAEEPYDLLICDFVQMARNAVDLDVPAKILFQHNVEAQIFQRHAQSDDGWLRRQYMGIQAKKMRRFECSAGKQFDAVIAVSELDQRRFQATYGWDHVRAIPTAVDTKYFHPNGTAEHPGRVVFIGSLDWLPNQDGVRHFVRQVWPEVRRQRSDATFQVVGRNPSPAIRQLAAVPGVEVVGTVRDVRPFLAEAEVVVVPLLVGGGTRLKIFEAMAMGKAVVSTSLGAEGLGLAHGKQILLADGPERFAETTIDLLAHPERRDMLARRAREEVVEKFSTDIVARHFEAICLDAVGASL